MPLIWWPVVSPTPGSRFANVPFANVSCRSAKKRNERCACICFVLSVVIQKSAICMCIPLSFSHWSGESSWGTDPTRTRNDFRSWRAGRWRSDSYAKRPLTFSFILFVYFVLFQTTRLGGNWRLPTHQSQHDGTRSGIKADHFQSWTFAEAFNTGASSFYRKLIWFIY